MTPPLEGGYESVLRGSFNSVPILGVFLHELPILF